MKKTRIAVPLLLGALVAAVAVPVVVTSASAANECLVRGYGYSVYDYAEIFLPSGTCKYGSVSGRWDVNGQPYYSSRNKRDMQPWSVLTVGYDFPAGWEINLFGYCSDTATYSCITSNWQAPNR